MTNAALRQILSATGYMADGEAARGVLLSEEARLGSHRDPPRFARP